MAPEEKPKVVTVDSSNESPTRGSNGYTVQTNFRTLSIQANDGEFDKKAAKKNKKEFDAAAAIREIDVHLIPLHDIFTRFSTSPTLGLEQASVKRKLREGGKNVITPPATQYWKKALNYVFGGFNFLMWIAFIVTIISYKPLGEPNPAIFNLGVAILLLLVIIISATFYAVVDFHASRIMNSIRSLIAENATVIRDGQQTILPATDVLVGDLVSLSIGDRVPADLRIIEMSADTKFDRSLLTGESDAVNGSIDATSEDPLETHNLALSSTFVIQGTCKGIVFAIGDNSIMGRVISMSGQEKFKLTTIQREVWFFTKIISILAISLFALSIIVWGGWTRKTFPGFATASVAIINSIGCLTAFVPQGLPVCVALSLTIIAKRMAKRSVLVKNLATIETLGCMSVLCSDKTGTLTLGKMTVQNIAFFKSHYHSKDLSERTEKSLSSLKASITPFQLISRMCNGATFNANTEHLPVEERTIKGNPTDVAVLQFAENLSHISEVESSALPTKYEKVFEIPFNSTNKWMLSLVRQRSADDSESTFDPIMLVKGAPDVLFPCCTTVLDDRGIAQRLDNNALQYINALQAQWSSQGQRVIALCMRTLDAFKQNLENTPPNVMEDLMQAEMSEMTLVALVGIYDPLRSDIRQSVEVIRRAGVRVFMVTGDFKLTAVAIASQAGIITQERVDDFDAIQSSSSSKWYMTAPASAIGPREDDPIRALVLTGEDIHKLTTQDWDAIVGQYTEIVFARTTPEQKLKIVEAIKARGDNTVAVTGDGVNDAPALKASDIGIAMGSGSDVAKEAASMVLMNNDFSSILVAIENGRLVFDNLKKVILYLMPAGTYTEFMTVFANVFLGMQLALSSYLQVCFSITNDVVMSISLMYEKPEADLMLRKPRNARTDKLTDWKFFFQIYLFIGLMMWPCAMAMWFLYMSEQGLGFHQVILVFDKWTDGWQGKSADELALYVSTGQCIYYVTIVFLQYGGLLAARNRRLSTLQSNPLWGPRRNLAVPAGMVATALIAVANLYGPGLQRVFITNPIPGKFWGIPFGFALAILLVDETRKLIVRTYPKSFVAKMAW